MFGMFDTFDTFDTFGGFGGFDWFGVIFAIVFLLVIGVFISTFVRGIVGRHRDNAAPRLTVAAAVVARRTEVSGGGKTAAFTHYYVTFQVESGDRMELSVDGEAYGMLAEGDLGALHFQGKRYLGFDRREKDPH